ncbi:hypothetical protein XENOCAPTIV_030440 [Xenoophorus captivus]|uniref:Uncharacterized protein n=1 Tax=Xenoophorus captivus TaxID=1517983 RepID=A0ABV0R619_9TELE
MYEADQVLTAVSRYSSPGLLDNSRRSIITTCLRSLFNCSLMYQKHPHSMILEPPCLSVLWLQFSVWQSSAKLSRSNFAFISPYNVAPFLFRPVDVLVNYNLFSLGWFNRGNRFTGDSY